ncbi:hypothetical protein FSARC_12155 [Fusarium sarcochroum]|uniref:Uncharacterized protein n=1 Tax=Fusarium sarcochroum TaxID=1208366 RepID=A0A8H4TAM7_9HYPO|nr:hypothetical protein FSARC_12155 [Fusarium sarcochroum]
MGVCNSLPESRVAGKYTELRSDRQIRPWNTMSTLVLSNSSISLYHHHHNGPNIQGNQFLSGTLSYQRADDLYATSTYGKLRDMNPAEILQPSSIEYIHGIQLDLKPTFRRPRVDLKATQEGDEVYLRSSVSWSLAEMFAFLQEDGVFMPTGQCAEVYLGGHVQMGGCGMVARSFGLLEDYVRELDMVGHCGKAVVLESRYYKHKKDKKSRNRNRNKKNNRKNKKKAAMAEVQTQEAGEVQDAAAVQEKGAAPPQPPSAQPSGSDSSNDPIIKRKEVPVVAQTETLGGGKAQDGEGLTTDSSSKNSPALTSSNKHEGIALKDLQPTSGRGKCEDSLSSASIR